MTILSELQSEGWYLSHEGFELCSGKNDNPSISSLIKKALDMDLREIGGSFLPEDLSKGKVDSISGPGVVQIQKVKNASAPKYEYGSGAPPVLRLLLTDGNNYINCLQWGHWKSISLETPPGTKILLKSGKIPMQSNFLLLSEHQFTVLGGCVSAMVEKWELCRKLASHIRTKENLDGNGPPPWIPFGQTIVKPSKSGSNFRSLESEAKEAKEDAVFKQQRQANIAEVSRVKEIKSKSFGGRKEKPTSSFAATKPGNMNASFMQSTTYVNSENDYKKFSDSNQNSPMRNRPGPSERNRKMTRNDYTQRPDNGRPHSSSNSGSQSNMKDNKLENKYKLGDFITQDFKQRSVFPAKTYETEPSFMNSPKQYRSINKDYRQPSEKRPQKSDPQNLVSMMEQVKIHGYDRKDDKNNFVLNNTFLRPDMEVMAKYWEDNQFYRAIVHAVGKEGKTCVVQFLDYGNYEEVLVADVYEASTFNNKNWNAGPISFLPSSRNSYEHYSAPHSQNYKDISKTYQPSNRAYGRPDNRSSRTDYRSPAVLHQQPNRKDFNS